MRGQCLRGVGIRMLKRTSVATRCPCSSPGICAALRGHGYICVWEGGLWVDFGRAILRFYLFARKNADGQNKRHTRARKNEQDSMDGEVCETQSRWEQRASTRRMDDHARNGIAREGRGVSNSRGRRFRDCRLLIGLLRPAYEV